MNFVIEDNQPIPIKPKGRQYYFLDQITVGQNVLVETERDAHKVRYAMRHRGMEYTYRKTKDGWRIWYMGDKS